MLALEPPEATDVTFTSVLVDTCWAITPPTAKYVPPSPPVENTRLLLILLAGASASVPPLSLFLSPPQAARLSAMTSAKTKVRNFFMLSLLIVILVCSFGKPFSARPLGAQRCSTMLLYRSSKHFAITKYIKIHFLLLHFRFCIFPASISVTKSSGKPPFYSCCYL